MTLKLDWVGALAHGSGKRQGPRDRALVAGWIARCDGYPKRELESADERRGWTLADKWGLALGSPPNREMASAFSRGRDRLNFVLRVIDGQLDCLEMEIARIARITKFGRTVANELCERGGKGLVTVVETIRWFETLEIDAEEMAQALERVGRS